MSVRNTIQLIRRCACDEDGATAIEYMLIAAIIAIAIIGVIMATGDSLGDHWDSINTKVCTATENC